MNHSMNIKVKLTLESNAKYHEATVGTTVDIDIEEIEEAVEVTNHLGDALVAAAEKSNAAVDSMNDIINSMVEDGLVTLSEAIGEAFVSGDWDKALNSMVSKLADFAQQFGAYLISIGVAELAFVKSLKGLQGEIAIAAGIALVASAAALKAYLAKSADQFALGTNFAPGGMAIVGERGPELIHLPRGSKVTPNMDVQNQLFGGVIPTLLIRGADLQLVLDRNNKRQGRYR